MAKARAFIAALYGDNDTVSLDEDPEKLIVINQIELNFNSFSEAQTANAFMEFIFSRGMLIGED